MSSQYVKVGRRGFHRDLHRVLMENELGRSLEFNEIVHHVNGDTKDNRIENLQLMTRAEHATLHVSGEGNGSSILTESEVVKMRLLMDKGMPGTEVAKRFGVSQRTASDIKNRTTWKHL